MRVAHAQHSHKPTANPPRSKERFPYKDKHLTFGYFRALNSFQVHSAFTQLARAELVAGNEFLMSKRKGVSMETVETGLDPPLDLHEVICGMIYEQN